MMPMLPILEGSVTCRRPTARLSAAHRLELLNAQRGTNGPSWKTVDESRRCTRCGHTFRGRQVRCYQGGMFVSIGTKEWTLCCPTPDCDGGPEDWLDSGALFPSIKTYVEGNYTTGDPQSFHFGRSLAIELIFRDPAQSDALCPHLLWQPAEHFANSPSEEVPTIIHPRLAHWLHRIARTAILNELGLGDDFALVRALGAKVTAQSFYVDETDTHWTLFVETGLFCNERCLRDARRDADTAIRQFRRLLCRTSAMSALNGMVQTALGSYLLEALPEPARRQTEGLRWSVANEFRDLCPEGPDRFECPPVSRTGPNPSLPSIT